jgi:uncharacterized protein (DUF433 family)
MPIPERITTDPEVMGGKPCIRGMRITVGAVLGLMAAGHDAATILREFPELTPEDLRDALAYAAWRTQESEVSMSGG